VSYIAHKDDSIPRRHALVLAQGQNGLLRPSVGEDTP